MRDAGGPFVEDRSFLVGKMARLTLLPGHAIPYAGIFNRKLVANGADVKLVYAEGGLVIVTSGSALQDGSIGDVVRVRNTDSGVTVSGAVQPDGSVKVSGGQGLSSFSSCASSPPPRSPRASRTSRSCAAPATANSSATDWSWA